MLPALCDAWLRVEAYPDDVSRAREAAKQLLASQRECLPLWAAYAALEARAGQAKVCVWLCVCVRGVPCICSMH